MAEPGPLHRLLGVSAHADRRQIRAAYRRRAMELHPDRGGDPEAFRELARAYRQLVTHQPHSPAHHRDDPAPGAVAPRAPAHVIATYVALAVAVVAGLRSLVAFDLDRMVLGFQLAGVAGGLTLALVWWFRGWVSR